MARQAIAAWPAAPSVYFPSGASWSLFRRPCFVWSLPGRPPTNNTKPLLYLLAPSPPAHFNPSSHPHHSALGNQRRRRRRAPRSALFFAFIIWYDSSRVARNILPFEQPSGFVRPLLSLPQFLPFLLFSPAFLTAFCCFFSRKVRCQQTNPLVSTPSMESIAMSRCINIEQSVYEHRPCF